MHEDALNLIRLSAGQASAKLQYLRIAFGAAGSAPGIISMEEIKGHVEGMFGSGKANIIWGTDQIGLEKSRARLLLNLIMLAVQAIPRGGDLTIQINRDTQIETLLLRSEGRKARLDAAVVQTMAGKAPEDGFDGRSIQPFYAGMISRELKGRILASADGDVITFKAELPLHAEQSAAE